MLELGLREGLLACIAFCVGLTDLDIMAVVYELSRKD